MCKKYTVYLSTAGTANKSCSQYFSGRYPFKWNIADMAMFLKMVHHNGYLLLPNYDFRQICWVNIFHHSIYKHISVCFSPADWTIIQDYSVVARAPYKRDSYTLLIPNSWTFKHFAKTLTLIKYQLKQQKHYKFKCQANLERSFHKP